MRHKFEPRIYQHEQLMNEFNLMLMDIKAQLYGDETLKSMRHKPTVQEIDILTNRIMEVLKQDSKPVIRY